MKINDNGTIELSESESKHKAAYIAGLREFADWLESVPIEAPISCDGFRVFTYRKDVLLAMRRATGLSQKEMQGDYLRFIKHFSGGHYFQVYSDKKNTCERVKVGEKTIPARPETVLPAEPEKVVEVFEWLCPESILADSEPVEAAAPLEREPATA